MVVARDTLSYKFGLIVRLGTKLKSVNNNYPPLINRYLFQFYSVSPHFNTITFFTWCLTTLQWLVHYQGNILGSVCGSLSQVELVTKKIFFLFIIMAKKKISTDASQGDSICQLLSHCSSWSIKSNKYDRYTQNISTIYFVIILMAKTELICFKTSISVCSRWCVPLNMY